MPNVSLEKQDWLAHAELLRLLHYDPTTGHFYNRVTEGGRIAGRRSGSIGARGYLIVTIRRRPFLAHRLAWFYVHGSWPLFNIDHINGEKLDNRSINLRDLPQSSNVARARRGDPETRGVRFSKGAWEANIKLNGVARYLGRFTTMEAAKAAYDRVFSEAHGWDLLVHPPTVPEMKSEIRTADFITKKVRRTVTREEVVALFNYDPETGLFTRKIAARGNIHPIGETAGATMRVWGHRVIKIRSRGFLAHRLAWLVMTGAWPAQQVDHINGDPADNRWANLRLATASENMINRGVFVSNKIGAKGVWRVGRRFAACITRGGTNHRLGRFDTVEEAVAAYKAAAAELHGEFARAA